MYAALPVVDDFNDVDSATEGPEEVRSDSSLEVLDEEEELGGYNQVVVPVINRHSGLGLGQGSAHEPGLLRGLYQSGSDPIAHERVLWK